MSSHKRRSSRGKHRSRRIRDKCKPITRKKVCGPSRSCRYPKSYSRAELVKKALKNEDILDEFGSRRAKSLSTPQLCSHLGLATRESVQFNRIINGRKCGPEPDKWNPKV